MNRVNWTSEILKKNACFQGSHFVCVSEGREVVMGCVGWVCGYVNEVCMEVTGCVGVGWVCVWGCGWVGG